ncbi:hypothetical protein [Bacteroides sp.]|uniref:hypothetical protein n=1 Tax=Bacteroides sp. TaxID=29523 RepID=UPI004026BA48
MAFYKKKYFKYCKGTDGVIDYDRTGRIIAKMNADIVCLQGLDKETERSEGIFLVPISLPKSVVRNVALTLSCL